jgi:hypothetical protein
VNGGSVERNLHDLAWAGAHAVDSFQQARGLAASAEACEVGSGTMESPAGWGSRWQEESWPVYHHCRSFRQGLCPTISHPRSALGHVAPQFAVC